MKKIFYSTIGILIILQLVLLTHSSTVFAQTILTMPNVSAEMLSPDYWIDKVDHPDEKIMTLEEIQSFNDEMRVELAGYVVDLKTLPESYPKTALEQYLNMDFPKIAYVEGKELGEDYWLRLRSQLNLQGIQDQNPVVYGLTVRRTNLKIFPTADIVIDAVDDPAFDQFQDSAVLANEPILILHQSLDKKWLYIRMYNCGGWVAAKDVGICPNRESWLKNQENNEFLTVTGNRIKLDSNIESPEISGMEYTMGTILPLAAPSEIPESVDGRAPYDNYVVKVPVRTEDGSINYKLALIPVSKDVSVGFLPYTRANIIKQAFKMSGDRYGWGGMLEARDCSALILEIYRCFGFKLPRNSATQGKGPGKIADLSELSTPSKSKLLDELLPGATLHFPGHVMMYLGKDNGRYYVISALGSFAEFTPQSEVGVIIRARTVVVNDLSIKRSSGKQWMEVLIAGKQWEKSHFVDLEGFADGKAIEDLADRYMISGIDSTRFDPSRLITRAEFSAILFRILRLEEDSSYGEEMYKDVKGRWYAGAVGALAKEGFLVGQADGRFLPDNTLTHQDMQSILQRILRKQGKIDPEGTGLNRNSSKVGEGKEYVTRYEAAVLVHHLFMDIKG